ncbi:enoyl-CoA hydratase/isomerase family protein [Anoxynatronum buryatiense]|nr:enoyl-CoA hydratase-related protein [Anoxynatronum buryatiense]
MTTENLLVEVTDQVAVVKMNRPKVLNALNSEVLKEIEATMTQLENSPEVRVIVLTGEGKAFVAGADIGEMKDLSPQEARDFSNLGHRVFIQIHTLEVPVIAALNGFTLGGGLELALACDFRYASEEAKLGFPEASLGIITGFGGTQFAARAFGLSRTKELIYTGEMITAHQALNCGLVNRVFPHDDLMAETMAVARRIIRNSPEAISLAKEAIVKGYDLGLREALELESDYFSACFALGAHRDRMKAFLENRKERKK